MEDKLYKSGYSKLNRQALLKEALNLREANRKFSFNVVTLIENDGQDISVASFNDLNLACDYLNKTFKMLTRQYLEMNNITEKELLADFKPTADVLEPTYGLFYLEDYALSMKITINEIFTKETYINESSSLSDESGIEFIDEVMFNNVIDAFDNGSKEYYGKKYLMHSKEDDLFLAIDNTDGCCWVEQSPDRNKIILWLNGEISTEKLYE